MKPQPTHAQAEARKARALVRRLSHGSTVLVQRLARAPTSIDIPKTMRALIDTSVVPASLPALLSSVDATHRTVPARVSQDAKSPLYAAKATRDRTTEETRNRAGKLVPVPAKHPPASPPKAPLSPDAKLKVVPTPQDAMQRNEHKGHTTQDSKSKTKLSIKDVANMRRAQRRAPSEIDVRTLIEAATIAEAQVIKKSRAWVVDDQSNIPHSQDQRHALTQFTTPSPFPKGTNALTEPAPATIDEISDAKPTTKEATLPSDAVSNVVTTHSDHSVSSVSYTPTAPSHDLPNQQVATQSPYVASPPESDRPQSGPNADLATNSTEKRQTNRLSDVAWRHGIEPL